MKKPLKLFIWPNFESDYKNGLAFAIAQNLEEAKKLVEKRYGFVVTEKEWGRLEIRTISRRIARCVSGGG